MPDLPLLISTLLMAPTVLPDLPSSIRLSVVEITDDFPTLRGRLVEHGGVI
jgi:hypothetical protein